MNERIFANRVRACAHRLHRIAYLILKNEADCEDAVQEALLRAWRMIGSLRDERLFETWLIRIHINECKKIVRLRARRPQVALADDYALPSNESIDCELRDAVRALEIQYRLPLILHHLEGYTQEEVARMLKLPATTVKWRLHQARKMLRMSLEGGSAQ